MSEKRDVTIDNKFGRQVIKIEFKKKKRPGLGRTDPHAHKQVTDEEIRKKQDVLRRAEETEQVTVEQRSTDLESQRKRAVFFGDRKLLREIRATDETTDQQKRTGFRPMNRGPSDRSFANRPPANRGPSDRPFMNRGPSDRTFTNRGPSDRPFVNRGPSERSFINRTPSNRGPSDRPFTSRGPSDRPFMNRGPSDRPFTSRGPSDRPFVNRGPSDRPFMNRGPSDRPFANRGPSDRPVWRKPGEGSPRPFNPNASKFISQLAQQVKSSPLVRKQIKKPPIKLNESSNKNRFKTTGQNPMQLGHRFLGEIHSPEDVDFNTERTRSISSFRRSIEKQKRGMANKTIAKVIREITVFDDMPVATLAHLMAVSLDIVLMKAREMGLTLTKNDQLSIDESYLLVEEFGHKYKKRVEILDNIDKDKGESEDYIPRAPVVTVVGHVDHGKTSLLDALRATQFTATESGGITQGIGASQVYLPDGRFVTFIDTPGHEIFTEMRARGVNITDIVLLIIAADDGIKEQTIESIQHAQAAKASIIVVITKADKPGTNVDKIKQMLMNHNIVVESLGGDTPDIEVSAKTGHNLNNLMELILLQSEMLELSSNPKPKASGNVIEAYMDKNLGPTATLIIRNGTLRKGDAFLCGNTYGRVRAINDWQGKNLSEAGPSTPVRLSGFTEVPVSGDDFIVMQESNAKEAALKRKELSNVANFSIQKVDSYTIADIWQELTGNKGITEMNFVVKADNSGSCEAIVGAIEKINKDKVKISVILKSVGAVTDSDILLAKASKATVIAFKTDVKPGILKNAETWGVPVHRYDIIYQILDDIEQEIDRTLAPKEKEVSLGRAEIREIFVKHKIGTIAGCIVTEGIIKRDAKCILWRNGVQVYTSTIHSIRQFRDDKREVKAGQECGIMINKFSDYHVGDSIECMHMVEITNT